MRAGLHRQSNHLCMLEHVCVCLCVRVFVHVCVFEYACYKKKLPAPLHKYLKTFDVQLPWWEARFLRASMPLSPYMDDEEQTLYACFGFIEEDSSWNRHHSNAFPLAHNGRMCRFSNSPLMMLHFILPLLNGNNDIQLFYSFHAGYEIGGWWCISWQTIWQCPPGKKKNLFWVFLPGWW